MPALARPPTPPPLPHPPPVHLLTLCVPQVFDDVAVELAMALLQFFNSNPAEEQLFRTMKALARFCQVAPTDVPQLVQMIGPEPAKFKGTSKRVDEQIQLVQSKMR